LTRRRAATLSTVLLIGLLGGVTLAVFVGARRNATTYHRLVNYVRPYDVLVNPDDGTSSKLDPVAVTRLPQVREATAFDGFSLVPTGVDPDQAPNTLSVALTSPEVMGGLWHPRVIAGRLPDPGRDDEALVDRQFLNAYHVHVGDTLHMKMYGPLRRGGPPVWASLPALRVTGLAFLSDEVSRDQVIDEARLILTPAFDARHHQAAAYFGVMAWLHHRDADVPAFRTLVQAMVPDEVVEFQTQRQTADTAERAIRPETVALVAFGVLAAVVTLVVAGPALARRVADGGDDNSTLAAIGLTRRTRLCGLLMEAVVIAAAGATLAAGAAAAASPLFPIGPAGNAEPFPGFDANVAWLAAGWGLVTVLLSAVTMWPAWRATRVHGTTPSRTPPLSWVVRTLARSGARPPAVVGVRMALEPGRDGRAVPLRSALFASIVTLSLLLAVIVFGAGLHRLLADPGSYGWTWDASVDLDAADPQLLPVVERYLNTVTTRPQVREASVLENTNVTIHGVDQPALGWRTIKGQLAPTLLAGRLPTGPDEMALGAQTMSVTRVHIGDVTEVRGVGGARPIRIVGEVVLPAIAKYSGADNAALGTGVLLNQAGTDAIAPAPDLQHLVVTLSPRSNAHAVMMGGHEDMEQAGYIHLTNVPQQPGEIIDLGHVRAVPLWLAFLFGAGAAAAIANLVGTAVIRRRRDLGLLKALGFERRQLSGLAAWYASTMATITTVVAVPLGLVAGRWAWRWLADSIGVSPVPAVPVWPFVLALPVAVLVATVVAVAPARRAARRSTAQALRSE
jgi:ABC-type lipoprotein release transport system permease subunit